LKFTGLKKMKQGWFDGFEHVEPAEQEH